MKWQIFTFSFEKKVVWRMKIFLNSITHTHLHINGVSLLSIGNDSFTVYVTSSMRCTKIYITCMLVKLHRFEWIYLSLLKIYLCTHNGLNASVLNWKTYNAIRDRMHMALFIMWIIGVEQRRKRKSIALTYLLSFSSNFSTDHRITKQLIESSVREKFKN